MTNEFASGEHWTRQGIFVSKLNRIDRNTIHFSDDVQDLEFFFDLSWPMGEAIIYKDLFFLQQQDNDDEWAAYRIKPDSITQFDIISFDPIIERGEFEDCLNRLRNDL